MKLFLISLLGLITACTPFRDFLSPQQSLFERSFTKTDRISFVSIEESGNGSIRNPAEIFFQEISQAWYLSDTIQVLDFNSPKNTKNQSALTHSLRKQLALESGATILATAVIRQETDGYLFDPDQITTVSVMINFMDPETGLSIGRIKKTGVVKSVAEFSALVRSLTLR